MTLMMTVRRMYFILGIRGHLSIILMEIFVTSTHNDLLGPRPGLGGNLAIASRAAARARSSASASATAAAAAAVKAGSSSCLLALHLVNT